MAPRHETPQPSSTRRLFPFIPESWSILTFILVACALVGLILFIVGIVGVVNINSRHNQVRDWIFLTFGALMLAVGLTLILLCRMRTMNSSRQTRRENRRRTRPLRREPLPVWTVDAIDPSFRPPPSYYEALHCTPQVQGDIPNNRPSTSINIAQPPPYTPTANLQQRITDV